jgi:uncharacterized membrane protein YgcG
MQGEGSFSSSQAQSDMFASLFAVIVSFHFTFIYTCSFEFIVMFYLIYVMFLFAEHNGLSAAIGADSWVVARPGVALDSGRAHGRRGEGSGGGGGSSGGGGSRGADGSCGAGWVVVQG